METGSKPASRGRKAPPRNPQIVAEGPKNPRILAGDAFFQHVNSQPDNSQADVTVYRTYPFVDNTIVGLEKSMDVVPAGEFSLEWLRTRGGYGRYECYYNNANNRPAYCKGLIDLREPALYEEMMDPKRCKLNLRTVLEVEKNRGYIKAWIARGMWPPKEKEDQPLADATLATGLLELVNRRLGEDSGGKDNSLLPIVLELIKSSRTTPAPEVSKADIAAAIDAAVAKARLESENERLKAEIERLKANPMATPTGNPFSQAEALLAKRLTRMVKAELDGEEADDEGIVNQLVKIGGPLLRKLLARIDEPAPVIALNPQPAGRPPQAETPASEEEQDLAMLRQAIQAFLDDLPPVAGASVFLIGKRQAMYEQLQDLGAEQVAEMATALPIPEAAQLAPRKAEFLAWVKEALEAFSEEEPESETPEAA